MLKGLFPKLYIFFILLLAACQPAVEVIMVTKEVVTVEQVTVMAPTAVVEKVVTATPLPTADPTSTPEATPTPTLPLATGSIPLLGHEGGINSVVFSPDGELVLAASDDGTARLWNLEGELVLTLSGHSGAVNDASYSLDGRLVATSSDDRTVRLWTSDGELLHVLGEHSSEVSGLLFTPDGRFLIANARQPIIWDLDGNLIDTLEGHRSKQVSSWVSGDGRYLLTSSGDATVFLWELDEEGNAELIQDLSEAATDGHILRYAFFMPQSDRFITGSLQSVVWQIGAENEVNELSRIELAINMRDIAFLDDDILFLEIFGYATMQITHAVQQTEPIKLEGHTSNITEATFSPDKAYVLSSSTDHTSRLWDLEGETVLIFSGHELPVRHQQFSPNQQYVVTGDRDGGLLLWPLPDFSNEPLTKALFLTGH